MNVTCFVEETVSNQYTIKVNKEALEKEGITFNEFLSNYDSDIYEAQSDRPDIIEDIIFVDTVEYIESKYEEMQIEIKEDN